VEETIFVTGASGFIGSHLVPALVAEGYDVVALVRPTSDTSLLCGTPARLVTGDVTDLASLMQGLEGCQAVVHLAAATQIPDPRRSYSVTVGGTDNLITACKAQGVSRVIAISTITTGRKVVGAYGEAKRKADALLMDSGLAVTILRPSLVYGPGAGGLFRKMLQYIEKLPVVPIIGSGRYLLQPVHVGDVVEAIIRCLQSPETIGNNYDLVGPDDIDFNQFVEAILEELGVRKPMIHLPASLCLLGARALSLVFSKPPISTDNVIGMIQDTPFDREPARRDLAFSPRGLREGLRSTLHPAPARVAVADHVKRIGIVGLGRMGVLHAALTNAIPEATLVAVTDTDRGLARYVRSLGVQAHFYPSLEVMLEEAELDGVFICTPSSSHLHLARQCVEKGLGVFVEKPLAESLDSAKQMLDLVSERRVVHAAGYTFAHLPIFQKARRLLREGVLGSPHRFRASMYLSQVLTRLRGWHYDPERAGGGAVINVASHLLFLITWFFGQAERVDARTLSVHSAKVEDCVSAILEFPGGLIGTLDASWSVPGYDTSSVEIVVEAGNGLMEVTEGCIRLWLRRARGGFPAGWSNISVADLPSPAGFELGMEGYYAEDVDFIRCLGTGASPLVSWQEGVAVQRLIDGIYRSAQSKEVVPLI
jgi:predicted dehydrogenase/nucleoside-diphosphate-sugar epimerase